MLRHPRLPVVLRAGEEHRARFPEEREVVLPPADLRLGDHDSPRVSRERAGVRNVASPRQRSDRQPPLAAPVNAGIVPEHEVHQPRQTVKQPHRARRILERHVDDLLHGGLVDDRPVAPAPLRDRIVVGRPRRAVAVVVGGNRTKTRMDAAAEHHASLPLERRRGFRLQRGDLRRDAGQRCRRGRDQLDHRAGVGRDRLVGRDAGAFARTIAGDAEVAGRPAALHQVAPQRGEHLRKRRRAVRDGDDGQLQLRADQRDRRRRRIRRS